MDLFLAALVYGSVIVAAITLFCVDRIETATIPILVAIAVTPLGFTEVPEIFVFTLIEVTALLFIPALFIRESSTVSNQRVPWPLVFLLVFYLVRFVVDFALTNERIVVYLRDVRIVADFLVIVFLAEVMRTRFGVKKSYLVRFGAFAIAVDIFYFWFGEAIGVRPSGIVAELLFRTDFLRYQDSLSIVLFGFLNYIVFLPGKMYRRVFAAFLMVVIAALSINRIFLVFSAFAGIFLLWEVLGRNAVVKWFRVLIMVAILVMGIWVGAGYLRSASTEEGEVALRFLELLDWELFLAGLQLRFVEPALAGGYEFSWISGLFGMGPSFQFFIPWFEYRGLDPNHSSVDSLLMFTYVKLGLVGLILVATVIRHCLWQGGHFLMNTWVWAFLFVHNGIAVVPFLLFIFLSLLSKPFMCVNILDRSALSRALEGSWFERNYKQENGVSAGQPA